MEQDLSFAVYSSYGEGFLAMPMIMLLNLKGGVAKTTNAVCIAEYLASTGKKVLVIDADHQSLAGELLLGQQRVEHVDSRKKTLHDLLAFMLSDDYSVESIPDYVTKNASNVEELQENLDCIACSHRIDEFASNMAKARRGYMSTEEFQKIWNRHKKSFGKWCNSHYDFTIIDCPPNIALQVQFFLGCSDFFIVPSIPDRLSVRGSLYLIERVRMRGYRTIHCLGTLWSMVRVQVRKHLEIMDLVSKKEGEYAAMPKPFSTHIPNTAAIADAMDDQGTYPIIRAKYQFQALNLYRDLCKEIIGRITLPEA